MMLYNVIIRISDAHPIKAYADVVLDEKFCVTGIKIVEGPNGVFVSMPQKRRNGAFKDVFFPINGEARQEFIGAVLSAYEASIQVVD